MNRGQLLWLHQQGLLPHTQPQVCFTIHPGLLLVYSSSWCPQHFSPSHRLR